MKTTGKIFHQNVIIPEMADFVCVNLYSDDILFYSKSHERCCLFNSVKKREIVKTNFFFFREINFYHLAGFVFQFRKLSFRLG